PARTEDDFHRTRRRVHRTELKNGLARRFACQGCRIEVACENIQRFSAAAALIARLALSVFFGDAQDVESHERLSIRHTLPIRSNDQDVFGFVEVAGLDLRNSTVETARRFIRLAK